jgi:hypothetical protein
MTGFGDGHIGWGVLFPVWVQGCLRQDPSAETILDKEHPESEGYPSLCNAVE